MLIKRFQQVIGSEGSVELLNKILFKVWYYSFNKSVGVRVV